MLVLVLHEIRDPETFWATVQDVIAGNAIPRAITVHACYPDRGGMRAVCLQEAKSIDAVRDWIEEKFGSTSANGYFEVATESAFALGLPRSEPWLVASCS